MRHVPAVMRYAELSRFCRRLRWASSSLRLRRREAAHEIQMEAPDDTETICVFGDSHGLVPRRSGDGGPCSSILSRAAP